MVPVACLLTLASVASDGSSELSSHMVHSSAYRCCVGQTIRVQVSDKTVPGQYDVTFNADTGSFEFSGYLPRILNLIEMETGLRIELTPVNVAQGLVNSYKMIADGDFDIGFSLPTWYATLLSTPTTTTHRDHRHHCLPHLDDPLEGMPTPKISKILSLACTPRRSSWARSA